MVPWPEINPASALAAAFESHGVTWARILVSLGALAGMTTRYLMFPVFSSPKI